MPIRCECPNGHALRVKDKLAGGAGVCPTCGAEFLVPTLPASGHDLAEAPPLAAGPTPPPIGPSPVAEEAIEWRVTLPDGQQYGPTVPTVFGQWITAGRITADSLVWRTGWDAWRRADEAAADLPAPLPSATPDPAAPPIREVPVGATLPPTAEATTRLTETNTAPAAAGGSYSLRKKRQARRRRNFTLLLAVACLALIAMLVWLVVSGPPDGAPVVPVR